MNAISHAATALLIKKKWPSVPLVAALVSVQLIEFLWVALNLAGVEMTTTETEVRSIADIHLVHMPFSHSIAATLLIAFVAWLVVAKLLNRPAWAIAVAAGVLSHILLDVAVHVRDIEVIPFTGLPKVGTGLYGLPVIALVVELAFGIFCWWVYRGSKMLLVAIVGLNLAALSVYVPQLPGPEALLAGHERIFAGVILVHIVLAQLVVWVIARTGGRRDVASARDAKALV